MAEVAKAHGERLKRYLAQLGIRDGEDIAQETFERLLKRKADPALIRHPMACLKLVAARVAWERDMHAAKNRDASAKAAAEQMLELELREFGSNPANCDALEREARSRLASLDSVHRQILWLKVRYGYTNAEIAKRLRISEFKVKRYLSAANAKLDRFYPARRNTGLLRRSPKEE